MSAAASPSRAAVDVLPDTITERKARPDVNTITGSWLLRMKTPLGTIEAEYRFDEDGGVVHGLASDGDNTTELTDITVHDVPNGERVTWRQRITKPLRLNLEYDVTVSGDTLSGESRAGRLPGTPVTGARTSA